MLWPHSARWEFEQAALPHLDELFRTARWMTGDAHVAEDVVQDAYLRAWRGFDRFEQGSNCRAWLFTILRNCIHDQRLHQERGLPVDDSEAVLERQEARAEVSDHLTDQGILRALAQLPPEQREVLLLADVEQLTYKETSTVLDVPIGTVMSRLSRARRRLRALLTSTAEHKAGEKRSWAMTQSA